MKHACYRHIKPIRLWIQSRTANFTSRHAFEKSSFTTGQYLRWSTINRRLWLQLATSVSYQTFWVSFFSICLKRTLETWRCQNQLHHGVAPLGSKRVYFLIKAFVLLCDDDMRYAFATLADASGDWHHRQASACSWCVMSVWQPESRRTGTV